MVNKNSQNQKEKDNERKDEGLCVICGKPVVNIRGKPIPGLTHCLLHSNKHS
jgi:hypothetical protein